MLEIFDLALGAVEPLDLLVHPGVLDACGRLYEFLDEALDEAEVGFGSIFAEVGQGAEIPQAAYMQVRARGTADIIVSGERGEGCLIEGFGGATQDHVGRRAAEGGQQGVDAGPVEVGIAPVQEFDGIELMVDDAVDRFFLKGFTIRRFAERAVIAEAARAACDLGEFVCAQEPALAAVKFSATGEGNVADIEVKAHADGVGGDDVVDLAGLVEIYLGVARARAERAHDDGASAALALQQLGYCVDLLRGEGDDGGALGQLGDLGRAYI